MNRDKLIVAIAGFFIGIIFASGVFFFKNMDFQKSKNLSSPISQTTTPSVPYIQQKPKLTLNLPEENSQTATDTATLSGNIIGAKFLIVSTALEDLFLKPQAKDGSFSTNIKLDLGANEIQVTAFNDKEEQIETINRTITYAPDNL